MGQLIGQTDLASRRAADRVCARVCLSVLVCAAVISVVKFFASFVMGCICEQNFLVDMSLQPPELLLKTKPTMKSCNEKHTN